MLAVSLGQSMKNKALKMSLAWNIKSMRNLLLEIYGLFKQNYPLLPPSPLPAITLVRYNIISFHNVTKSTKEQGGSANLNPPWGTPVTQEDGERGNAAQMQRNH